MVNEVQIRGDRMVSEHPVHTRCSMLRKIDE